MGTLEIVKMIISGGELSLLSAVLYGLFRLTDRLSPQFLAAWSAQTKEIATLGAKIDAQTATLESMSRQSRRAARASNHEP